VDRRKLIKTGGSILIFRLTIGSHYTHAEQIADIIWNVPRSQVQNLRDALNFQGQITPKSNPALERGLPVLFVFAGAVAISTLARALVTVYKDMRYGGIVVTARDGKLNIANDDRLDSGTIVVYNNQNIKVYQLNESKGTDVGALVKVLNDITSSKPTK
jgi:hypothetical protein